MPIQNQEYQQTLFYTLDHFLQTYFHGLHFPLKHHDNDNM